MLPVGRTVLLNKTNVLSRDIPSHRVMASGLAGSLAGIAYGAFRESPCSLDEN